MWIEKNPNIGDTVKIEWTDWYSERIGLKSSIGVLLGFKGGRMEIDLGDKIILLTGGDIKVFN